jgi:hypothetical protein
LYANQHDRAISPDGKYLLAQQTDPSGIQMLAIPLDSSTAKDVVLSTVDHDWASNNLVSYCPVGWTSPTECVFVLYGWQNQGPHRDQRGVAILTADVTKPSAEEAAFIDLPTGEFRSATVAGGKPEVYIHVSKALWAFDLNKRSLRQVKGGLPIYDGLFFPKISSTGEYVIYEMHGTDKDGVYILETATGKERPLLPTGDTMSFLPAWSPDGKYIASYTVGQKPAGSGFAAWDRYQTYPGEDGPLPIAPAITVVDTQGVEQKSVQVSGKLLSYLTWAQDSKTLGFLTGTPKAPPASGAGSPGEQYEPVSYDSAMMADVMSKDKPAVRLADLTSLPGLQGELLSVHPATMEASGKGMFFSASAGDKTELWYASQDEPPARVADGGWAFYRANPIYEGHMAGVLSTGTNSSIWLVGAEGSRRLGDFDSAMSDVSIVGYNKDLLVVAKIDYPAGTGTLTVYRMFTK